MERQYKDSGIEWIGRIPKEWKTSLLSTLYFEHSKKNIGLKETNLLSLSYGRIIRKNINDNGGLLPESFEGYNIIAPNDIVFRLTDLQNDKRSLRTGLCTERGIITSAYTTLRSRSFNVDNRYFHYLFHSCDECKIFYGIGNGVRQSMNYQDLRKLEVIIPSIDEQKRIADYLDEKCGEIDELIEVQEQMIQKLTDYKQSVITEAVTKGLNPNARLVPSGIDWIGDVPEHWNVARIKNVLEVSSLQSSNGLEEQLSVTQKSGIIKSSEIQVANPSSSQIGWKIVKCGDIVFNKYKAHSGVFFVSPFNGIVTFNYSVYHCKRGFIPKYFEYLFKTPQCIGEFRKAMKGVGESISPLYTCDLFRIFIFTPPLLEQQTIVSYLDDKCSEINSLIALKQQKIEKLKDYKKSLIYEAVTGKIEIQ